jgi:hypothetical protein
VEKGPQNHHYWKSNDVVKHFLFLLFLLKNSADGGREGSECARTTEPFGQEEEIGDRKKIGRSYQKKQSLPHF